MSDVNELAAKVVEYLNQKTNAKFEANAPYTLELIGDRVKEGFNYEDFVKVIDKKYLEWIDTQMGIYLRPSTLFDKKFENYLNGKQQSGSKNRIEQLANSVAKAEQHDWKLGKK